MVKFSDVDILEGVRTGNINVLKYLIRSYYPKVRQLIRRFGGSDDDADDILQETLVILFEKLRMGEVKLNCQFGTYFLGAVRIIWLKELKKRGKQEKFDKIDLEKEITEVNIQKQLELRERQNVYAQYFNKLGEECKKLLELFFSGKKIKDITDEMNYSSDQHTKNRKYICKKKLIENIRSNPVFKEIKNERFNNITEIPRW